MLADIVLAKIASEIADWRLSRAHPSERPPASFFLFIILAALSLPALRSGTSSLTSSTAGQAPKRKKFGNKEKSTRPARSEFLSDVAKGHQLEPPAKPAKA
jgi:hypothetical protein